MEQTTPKRIYGRQCKACRKPIPSESPSGPAICSENCKVRLQFRSECLPEVKPAPWLGKRKLTDRARVIRKEMRLERLRVKAASRKKGSKKARAKLRLKEANLKIQSLEKQVRALGAVVKPRLPHVFYDSREWQELRYAAIRKYGRVCMACGVSSGEMHVDHVKPRSKYPHLELDINNLQVLCRACNLGKSNKYEDDWRK